MNNLANTIRFTDTVEVKSVDISKEDKDFFIPSAANPTPTKPLIVKIAATHAGIITRNNGFYLPDRMRSGATTFIQNYGKPIQVHHDQDADPVGRVIRAEYVDISHNIKDAFQKRIKDSKVKNSDILDKFLSGSMPFIESINFICDHLNRTDSVLDDPNYDGLGYIKLTAAISDPDAIQKILDQRYLTGSVGVTTNRAVCSVCKQDWTDAAGKCDHRPGKVYDGTKAFLITGDLTYDEYSFVNVPADRHSRVLESNMNGIIDSVKMDDSVGRTMSVGISLSQSIDLQDNSSTIEITSQEEPMANTKDMNIEDLIKLEEANDKEAIEKIFILSTVEEKIAALKAIRPFMDRLEELTAATYENAAAFYIALNDAEWNDYSELEDDAIEAWKAEHPEDATLSGSLRKKLPGSTFCGPNRSFPVPDSASVPIARRLIDKASISSASKSKILAHVSRKSNSFKPVETVKPIENIENKTEVACEVCKDIRVELDSVKVKLADIEATHVKCTVDNKALTDQLTTSTKELEDTRTELKLTHDDLIQVTDQLVTVKEKSLVVTADRVILMKQLSGETIENIDNFRTELLSTGEDKLDATLSAVAEKVDMKKIADSINSGLTRQPTGTVEDPTGSIAETKKVFDKHMVQSVTEEYMRIKFGGNSTYGRGHLAADRYLADMQAAGHVPTSVGRSA